ncbi:TPA: prepilin-type N-terminal cleavage/methylation domain-containing protein [Enterobacter kobei]|nr:prepilin-type N-terminal cleavage/methylation domain-containing protein [Enterobacter kobei]
MSKVPNGFTLLEVMLAIVIFSTLSFLASQVFSQATEQYQRAKILRPSSTPCSCLKMI